MGVIARIILLLGLAASLQAQALRNPFFTAAVIKPAGGGGGGGGSGGLTSTIFSETFEGTGYSTTSPAWTESLGGGTVDEDYTSTVLDGSQSWRILTADSASSYAYNSFTAGSERWVYFMFRPVSTPNSSNGEIIEIWNSGQTRIADLQLTSTGTIQVRHGTATATTSGTMSDGTTYHVYFRYVTGSGANGVASVGFSTDGTRPTGGSNFASTSSGTATTDANYIAPGWIGFSGVIDLIYDKMQVGDSTSAP